MRGTENSIETTGSIDADQRLVLDTLIRITGPARVRMVISPLDSAWEEKEWLRAAASNPAFEFLSDPEEDIYRLTDGKPFDDEG